METYASTNKAEEWRRYVKDFFEKYTDNYRVINPTDYYQYGKNYHKRWQNRSQRCEDGPAHPAEFVAHTCRDIDGENPRQRLRHCQKIEKFFSFEPVTAVDNFFFNNAYHGPSSAEGEGAYLEKRQK